MGRVFEGFEGRRLVGADGVGINAVVGGDGPPLLLLHGCPQTLTMWHQVAPLLADRFTVVAPDLRGYGASGKPPSSTDHAAYSFRAMARDQVAVMDALGFAAFDVAGHDRGARVAHRLALDSPERVGRVALLDVLPTLTLYDHTDRVFATAYWEWFFLTQDAPFPETVLGASPEAFLRHELGALVASGAITGEAWDLYLAALGDPEAVRGMCEDYRAGATVDLEHDRADLGRRISAPLLVLWGARNPIWERFDMLATWRERADHVDGRALDSGHYLAEEQPGLVASLLAEFFAGWTSSSGQQAGIR